MDEGMRESGDIITQSAECRQEAANELYWCLTCVVPVCRALRMLSMSCVCCMRCVRSNHIHYLGFQCKLPAT